MSVSEDIRTVPRLSNKNPSDLVVAQERMQLSLSAFYSPTDWESFNSMMSKFPEINPSLLTNTQRFFVQLII